MIVDYHVHTQWSDGKDPVGKCVEAARARGLDEIGFAEHYMEKGFSWVMRRGDMEGYLADLEMSKAAGAVPVRTGLEIDYIGQDGKKTKALLERYVGSIDYAIGSVHHLNGWVFTNPTWSNRPRAAAGAGGYERYYGLVRELAESGLFDIVGHLDVGKRYGYFPKNAAGRAPERTAEEPLWKALEAIAKGGLCVEINTSGLQHGCREAYPAGWILEMCHELDIGITLGSDAHRAADVGADMAAAVGMARAAGYDSLTLFEQRRRRQVELG